MKKRKYFDSVTKELRDKLEGKTIAFDDLMAMLLNAYDAGLIDGVNKACDAMQPVSENLSLEALNDGLNAGTKEGKAAGLKEGEAIGVRQYKIERAKYAADKRHSMPGGARDKEREVKEAWASGKYASRDICAEQECGGLGWSFKSARNALIGTPEPKNWYGKRKPSKC